MKKKILLSLAIIVMIGMSIFAVNVLLTKQVIADKIDAAAQTTLPVYTATVLQSYDGTDPALPIYLALDGYVYDVTAGKKFYQSGGSYHYLAGRDASTDLHQFGGDIIKKKYPIIGIFESTDQTAPTQPLNGNQST